ncbi:MAG: elongation factor G [bacterium]
MKDIAVTDVRNFVLMGHTASGKTTLADAMLYKMGINDRLGSVDQGTSLGDYTDEEKSRKTTIYAKSFCGMYKSADGHNMDIVFSDTPGYADFFGQVIQASRIAGAALITVDAHAGIQVGTMKAWKQASLLDIPRAIVVTGLDRENSPFDKVMADIQATWGDRCIPVLMPLPDNSAVVDVLAATDVPASISEALKAAKSALVEMAAETDDTLIEKYLAGQPLTAREIADGLRHAVFDRKLVPVFACMALKNVGVGELLDGIARFFPSPADRPMKDAAGKPIDTSPSAPFVGYVWRTVNDPFIGHMSFVYVCGGTLKADTEVLNVNKEQKERIVQFVALNGKKQLPITEAEAGDIVAIAKLKVTALGDSLCQNGAKVTFEPFSFPNPVMWTAVSAKTQGDEDKIGTALHKLAEDDPTIHVERHPDTHETILSGMGDTHLSVAVERMKKRNSVDVILSTPKIAYTETITGRAEGHYKHKKQSGGRGQYGEVYLKVEPLMEGDDEWFANALVGGAIPHNFVPAVQKGVVEGMSKGALAGAPMVKVKSTVYDGSYHDVDSSEIAFKIAGSRAFRDAVSKAKPVLLEPIMSVKITIPEHFMGDVNGDMSHRRGRIVGMESADGMQVITADIPQAELFTYCAELRSMTGGRGSFEMSFARYDVVPGNVAQKIIAATAKVKEEEQD